MFPLLEYYLSKSEEEIIIEYNDIIKKPEYDKDFDPILIVIIHDFMNNSMNFNDYELNLLAILIKLRKLRSVLYFRQFFNVMKDVIVNSTNFKRKDDIDIIRSIFDRSLKCEVIDFSYDDNTSPNFKNEFTCNIASPSINERYSVSDDLNDVPFQFINN